MYDKVIYNVSNQSFDCYINDKKDVYYLNKLKILLVLFFTVNYFAVYASNVDKAFVALKVYNYFEAKRLFEKAIKKEPAIATYGLSSIYGRLDNPFSNMDTAYKYVLIADDAFQVLPVPSDVVARARVRQPLSQPDNFRRVVQQPLLQVKGAASCASHL